MIPKVLWCDFVVWTEVDTHIEHIYFGCHFWENQLLPKLVIAYTTTANLAEKQIRKHSSGLQHTCYHEYQYLVGP